MTRPLAERSSLMRKFLLGSAALAALAGPAMIAPAAAKVGVTSATDGDPLGKPPSEAERVLRIGIDVQANELITTNATDRAHLVFLDGSSLTIGPNAQLTIDRFVFDPNTKTGELAINASKGVLRLVGGKISKTTPITITTPSSTIGIRGGITLLDVKSNQTVSTFVFGKNMTVTAGGATQDVTRPNYQVVSNLGARPGPPTAVPPGALSGQLAQLEGKSGGGQTGGSGRTADQAAQGSGFSTANSGQPVRIVTGLRGDSFGSGPGPRNRNPNDVVPNALTNANNAVQTQQAIVQAQEAAARNAPPTQTAQGGGEAAPQTGPQNQPTPPPFTPDLPPVPGVPSGPFDPNIYLTTVTELNTLNTQRATATYNGPAYATIGSTSQIATGTYQNVWSFGNRSGIATLNIDNTTYGGGSNANTFQVGNSNAFKTSNGPLQSTTNGTVAPRNATLEGFFISTPSTPAKYQLGTFSLTGPNNYRGSGYFIGTK